MGTVIFEGSPPFGALVAQSATPTPDVGFVILTLTLLPDANSQGTADLQVILSPEVAKELGPRLEGMADTAARWAVTRGNER